MHILFGILGTIFMFGFPMLMYFLLATYLDWTCKFSENIGGALWIGVCVPGFILSIITWISGTVGLFGLAFGAWSI